MSTKLFTKEEIELISENKYVKNVSERSITYTDEFRRIFIAEYEKGKFPRKIFEESGFVISILEIGRIESISKRWRTAYKKNGIHGLDDTRKGKAGRPRDKELSIEEKYERLKVQTTLLKAENELLKKLDLIERRVINRK